MNAPTQSLKTQNSRLKAHILRHWHHHLAVWCTAGAIAIVLFAGGVAAGVILGQGRGGYRPGPLPPITRLRGGPLPATWSLARYTVRIHNQGNSSSCVGQTLATIEEITWQERRTANGQQRIANPWPFSSGYIYDQVNGGQDGGTTYDAAFGILLSQGDAGLSVFPHDGQDWWVQPDTYAMHRAAPYRFATWRRIDPGDRYTIQAELAAGRPIAIAIPVTDSFYQQWGDASLPVIAGQSGAFHFSHSITGIGYSPAGVLIQNSWGPTWGLAGRAILAWSFLEDVGAEIVVSSSAQSQATSRKSQALSPELARIWGQYRAEHRLRAISYQLSAVSSQPSARKLTWAASLWKARVDSVRRLAHSSELVAASRTGGIVWERFFAPRRRCRGRLTPCPPGHLYTEDRFQGRLLVWWNGRPGWWPQWHARRWLR